MIAIPSIRACMTMLGTYRPKSPDPRDEERRILGTAYQAQLQSAATCCLALMHALQFGLQQTFPGLQ